MIEAPAMQGLFGSGRVVDLVFAVMAVNCALFLWLMRADRTPGRALNLLWTIAPGALLLLALRAALDGAPWYWVAAPLAASFPAHLYDLWRRGLIGQAGAARP